MSMTSLQDTHWQYMCCNYDCENRGNIWKGKKISPIDKEVGLQEFESLRERPSNQRLLPRNIKNELESKEKALSSLGALFTLDHYRQS